jgi:phage gpG-like protein
VIAQPIPLPTLVENLRKPLALGGGGPGGVLPIPPELGKTIGLIVVSDLKGRISRGVSPDGTKYLPLGHTRPNGGNNPLLSTGVLRNSITSVVAGNSISVGTNLLYGPVHQYGATIVPVKAKLLAIPITKTARYAGSPRRFPGKLTFVPTKSGGILKDAKGVVHYVLVDKVEIPARPFIGFSSDALKLVNQVAAEHYGRQAAESATRPKAGP